MHNSSYQQMQRIVGKYLDPKMLLNILDIGSYNVNGIYKPLFQWTNWKYTGADISAGPNVDVVLDEKYEWKMFEDGQFDVVISGQALEHMEYPWLAAKAIYRVCKVGGICAVIAPGVWEYHPSPKDCFRIYPDGMRSLFVGNAGFTEMECSMSDCVIESPLGNHNGTDTWFVGKKVSGA